MPSDNGDPDFDVLAVSVNILGGAAIPQIQAPNTQKTVDRNGVQVFTGHQELKVKPGENKPAAPQLSYSAPDVTVASISVSPKPVALDWAGAAPNDVSCLNRAPSTTS